MPRFEDPVMNSRSEYGKENGEFRSSAFTGDVDLTDEGKQRADLVVWLNGLVPHLSLPLGASDEELRACLDDGAVLCDILKRLNPRSIDKGGSFDSSEPHLERVKKFLAVMDEMGLPRFEVSDLEQGPMTKVLKCLLTLRAQFNSNLVGDSVETISSISKSRNSKKTWKHPDERVKGTDGSQVDPSSPVHSSSTSGEEKRKSLSNFKRVMCSPVMPDPSAALVHHVGRNFHEVFQLKQGRYADLPAANISEMMKSNSLDNAPTQSLLSVVNGILDESIDRKNEEIPHRVACLLRKVVQEIERRISTQAEQIRTQNNLYKAREEKYQSRIRVLETLATGTGEETQIAVNKIQQIKTEKTQMEERNKAEEQDVGRWMKEKEHSDLEISSLKQEIEISKKTYEQRCLYLEEQAKETQHELQERLKELQFLLTDSRKKEKELETFSALKAQNWYQKEHTYQSFINFQFGALRELRLASQYIKQEVVNTQNSYSEDFSHLGAKLKGLADAAENFNMVLAENRKLHNEVQDMKGNIRVYCRIRPSFSGQNGKKSIIDYIGKNGELAVVNPSKPGKESHRSFKFNKVFGPSATQEEVFLDTQPLIRSVLDGYNICIFAYGQTGSGKTYTMIGPTKLSKENWGVNYRALNDLFHISWKRRSTIMYEVSVQMVEIYNEQVRDLLTNDTSQKRLEIRSNTQANGLAVPDASMRPVKSTTDVMDLMQIGLTNRAMSSTAMNERSSRSHSIVTVHVRGTDLKTGAALRGSLHLVDLAGSERIDRSEVTGDRLKEAQHINKSLSSLGDVIFALAQKSPHVPYRNSKLTQVLQSSLGGQAKTLMFVQLNPDPDSFSESLSTLKFAERVSGVELGAARSSKEGKDVRELMEQVASLKDTIAMKDEEIEHLQLLKDPKTVSSGINNEKRGVGSLRHGSSSPNINSLNGALQPSHRSSGGKGSGLSDKAASDQDNCSEYSDRHSEAGSHQSLDDLRHDPEERSSDTSDGGHSMGIESESSVRSAGDLGHFTEGSKLAHSTEKPEAPSRISQAAQKHGQATLGRPSSSKDLLKVSRSSKKTVTTVSVAKPLKRRP